MLVAFLLAAQAMAAWSPPAQAAWSGKEPPVKVRIHAGTATMRGKAPIALDLTATTNACSISPFLQPTRGIAFEVTSQNGTPVAPATPMVGSPPPPPLATGELVAVTAAKPYHVATDEDARSIFPGPGRYRVRAHIFLFTTPEEPVRYAQLVSDTITVNVTN
ncbi:hypothetical protein [uncultured Sphingomonas sp.]|uniref:hypothetical protein n=1 Tax=uncultured Sphingomonas sp. TaxID=158754 RepID=UPI0025F72DB7|nr:hypothetical protein [uncultured Sphingomonas sp.]